MRGALFAVLIFLAACTHFPSTPTHVPDWPPVVATVQLDATMAELATPQEVEAYLGRKAWSLEACSNRWTPPQELLGARLGCCTGFARWWAEWARRRGWEAAIIAVWDQPDKNGKLSHAFTVFRPPKGAWMIGSNNRLYAEDDLGDDFRTASRAGAVLVFDPPAAAFQAWDALGRPMPL